MLLQCKDNVEFKISMQNHHKKALACFVWKFWWVNRKYFFYFKHSINWFWIHVSTTYYIMYDVIRQCRLQKHVPKTHGISPARLYYNFPASVLILDVCIHNQQAKQEDWPELFSCNIQEKRDLLAAVQGSCLQSCTITFAKCARLKSCKEHGTAGKECITLCTKRSRGKLLCCLN